MPLSLSVSQITLGVVLISIELARSVPAWLRIRKYQSTDGVSPISVGVLAGTSPAWIAVAIMADSVAAAVATAVWLVFHVLLWREASRANSAISRTMTNTSLIGLAASAIAGALGAALGETQAALGALIGIASAAYSLPALIAGMVSPTTTGLSLVSLSVNSIEGSIYLWAGLGLGGIAPNGPLVLGYIIFGSIALLSNLPRLVRTAFRRLTGKDGNQSEAHRLQA